MGADTERTQNERTRRCTCIWLSHSCTVPNGALISVATHGRLAFCTNIHVHIFSFCFHKTIIVTTTAAGRTRRCWYGFYGGRRHGGCSGPLGFQCHKSQCTVCIGNLFGSNKCGTLFELTANTDRTPTVCGLTIGGCT